MLVIRVSCRLKEQVVDYLKSRDVPRFQGILKLLLLLVGELLLAIENEGQKELTYNEQCKSNITHFYKEVQAYLNELKKESSNWHNSLIPSECELNETGEFSYAYEYLH